MDSQDPAERKELWDPLEIKEKEDLTENKVSLATMESLEPLAVLDPRDHREKQVCLDWMEIEVKREIEASQAQLPPSPRHPSPSQDPRDPRVCKDPQDPPDSQADQLWRCPTQQLRWLVSLAFRVKREQRVSLVLSVCKDSQETLAVQEHPA